MRALRADDWSATEIWLAFRPGAPRAAGAPPIQAASVFAFAAAILALPLGACSQGGPAPDPQLGVAASPRVAGDGDVPKGGGVYKVGRPYKVAGRWYVPREVEHYDRDGIASWYGTAFHGRRTANGEIFDMHALTAGHPTLPLPSYAYVTNLDNGRTILVRVNDRGPYVKDRLIDLSRRSATELAYNGHGLARVRVRYAGPAPLDGNDRAEREHLAQQAWNRPGAPPAEPFAADWPTASIEPNEPAAAWSVTSYRRQLSEGRRSAPGTGRSTLGGPDTAHSDVGAFATRAEAERMRHALERAGALAESIAVEEVAGTGAPFYVVRVGPAGTAAARNMTQADGRVVASAPDRR
jgi:rare lipoprotein A